jgi:hypothetical protein
MTTGSTWRILWVDLPVHVEGNPPLSLFALTGEITMSMTKLLFTLLVLLPPAAWTPAASVRDKGGAKPDGLKIQGRWDLMYAECSGADVTKKMMANWQSVVFDTKNLSRPNGGNYHPNPTDNFLQNPYQLDARKGPKGIAIKEKDGMTRGWYVLDDDCLILRLSIDYSTRKRGDKVKTLLILRRPAT